MRHPLISRSWILALLVVPLAACSDSAAPESIVPAFTQQPSPVTVLPGAPVSFMVVVTLQTAAALSYEWRKDGVPLVDNANVVGSSTATLTIHAASTSDVGTYTVIATATLNGTTAVTTSHGAALTLNPPPTFILQPVSVTSPGGSKVMMWVQVTGAPGAKLIYNWYHGAARLLDDPNRVGTQTPTLTLWAPSPSEAGEYTVLVQSNLNSTFSSTRSDPATVTLHYPPVIFQPQVPTYLLGQTATLPVTVTGSPGASFTYQWRRLLVPLADDGRIAGANSATLTIASLAPSDATSYFVDVTSTLNGTQLSVSSSAIELQINLAPVITRQPNSQTVAAGSRVYISVSVAAGPFFQWQKDGVDISDSGDITGTNSSVLVFSSVTLSDAGTYRVVLTSVLNGTSVSTTSSDAVLTVN